MKVIAITTLFCVFISTTNAQVGIQTENPKTTLDVNGDMNVTGKIYVSGTDQSIGNPGSKNEALTSNGESGAVTWSEVKIPLGYVGGLYLTAVEALSDTRGLLLSRKGPGVYSENSSLNSDRNWEVIPSLTTSFTLTHPINKVHMQFQTKAQIDNSGTASYACGFFINDKLKGTRVDTVKGDKESYNLFNMNASIDDLPTGKYEVKIACRARTFGGPTKLAIGRAISNNSTNLNSDMAQSTLNITVLEDFN